MVLGTAICVICIVWCGRWEVACQPGDGPKAPLSNTWNLLLSLVSLAPTLFILVRVTIVVLCLRVITTSIVLGC